jgi:outer membrane protein assembly factor BamB
MTDQLRLTDELLRLALTPPDDGADFGLDVAIREAVEGTEQRRYWWTALSRWFGPLGPSRELRLAGALALLIVALLGVAIAIGTKPPTVLGDGAMYHGGPARTGEMAGPGPAPPGAIQWSVSLPGPLTNGMPALVGDRLYVADGRGNVGVYDAATGAAGWSLPVSLPKPAGSPAIANGVLVVGAGDGLYGLDAGTGTVRWHLPTDGAVDSAPAIVAGAAYVGLPDGSVAAVDLQSGDVRWRMHVGGAITRAVSLADGLVFAGGEGGAFAALRVADGSIAWQVALGPGNIGSSAVRDGVVYAVSGLDADAAHVLYALDAATGNERWRFSTSTGESVFVGAIGPDLVYAVSLDGNVYALRNGVRVWTFDAGAGIGSPASLSGGLLYVSVSDGHVLALDAASGEKRWDVVIDGDPGPAIVAKGRVYVGTSLGVLAAIGENQ